MKKAISILLCLALVTVLCASVSAAELHPFADLNYNSWYVDGIMYVYEKGIMRGTSEMEFSPNENTTRAMIVTILYRLEGSPDVNNASSFTDVPADEWYADAVTWAARENIVNGYGNGKFGPQDCITRQQLAAILYRYSAYKGVSASANGWASSYPDANAVSGWARSCGFEKSAKKVSGRCPDKPHRRDYLPRDALLAAICLTLKGRIEKYAAENIGQAGVYRSARWMLCTLIPPERGTGRSRSGLSCRSRSD